MKEQKIIVVVGTRPEAIKLVLLYKALKQSGADVLLCATHQHTDLLDQVLKLFSITPDISLNIMQENQDLFYISHAVLDAMRNVYITHKPTLVIVQGDTTTASMSALAAFYLKIPVAHIEAGLRSHDLQAPFPEELNRRIISIIAQYHFAPTSLNVAHLLADGIAHDRVFCTGNTVVDALLWIKNGINFGEITVNRELQELVTQLKQQKKRIILLTAHRRESFGAGLVRIFKTIACFATQHPDIFVFYPVHPNPAVLKAIDESGIKQIQNIYCTKPIDYTDLIFLLLSVDLVLTDSGGIQEEAASLGKEVFVLREKTERVECLWEGIATLVGTNELLLQNNLIKWYKEFSIEQKERYIFGDGHAVDRIVSIIMQQNEIAKNKNYCVCST